MSVPEEHKKSAPKKISFAIFVVSTSRYKLISKGKKFEDKTGDIITSLINKANYSVIHREIIPDDVSFIRKSLLKATKLMEADVIIFAGGTGLSPKDVTLEAIYPLLNKDIPGFGELFRFLSYQEIGSSALLSRAIAGIYKEKVVFCLPGSPNACKLALEKLILPEIGHILKHVREK
ncbi:MAG: molybdenum cofactor biosynthesis protein B [Candidatus Njordarchaeum guaymaensis]